MVETIKMCGVILLIFSIGSLFGAVLCLMRKMWVIALICAIMGVLCVGAVCLGSIFAIVGLILIVISKEDFEGEQKPAPPPYGPYPPGPYPPPPGSPPY
jgi:hypothetical protein